MLRPGTRVVFVSDGQIVVRGNLFVVFAYPATYAVIGKDDDDETTFGVFDAQCVEAFHAPSGPEDPYATI